jgi:hypothetical protein
MLSAEGGHPLRIARGGRIRQLGFNLRGAFQRFTQAVTKTQAFSFLYF